MGAGPPAGHASTGPMQTQERVGRRPDDPPALLRVGKGVAQNVLAIFAPAAIASTISFGSAASPIV